MISGIQQCSRYTSDAIIIQYVLIYYYGDLKISLLTTVLSLWYSQNKLIFKEAIQTEG